MLFDHSHAEQFDRIERDEHHTHRLLERMLLTMSAISDSIVAFKASQDKLAAAVNELAAKVGVATDPDVQAARDALDSGAISNGTLIDTINAALNGTAPGAGPAVTGISPTSGSAGSTVNIVGSGFAGATGVNFSGTVAQFTVVSDTSINATVPTGATGTVDVVVTNANGKSVSAPFTYV